MSHIVVRDLFKSYLQSRKQKMDQRLPVLQGINLSVEKGELVTFFGPNACGKTTLLYIIAGLIPFDKGQVEIDQKLPTEAKKAFIFQNYSDSLFPWRRTVDNICFPLEITGVPGRNRREMAKTFIERLGLNLPLMAFPYELSGGQQQLLAILRALIYDPEVLLMDEPFGSLDYQTRISMQLALLDLWQKTAKTIVFVSHEIDEAIFLADRLVLLTRRPARILEILDVNLPRPRTPDMFESAEFFSLRTKALRIFKRAMEA